MSLPPLALRLRLSAAVTALAVVFSGGGLHGVPVARGDQFASGPAGVPSTTSSFYVYGSFIDVCGLNATTECPLFDDAEAEAVPRSGGMTILDFGAPCFDLTTHAWGTQLFNSQGCTLSSTLVTLSQAWLRGYETNPTRSASSSYVLVAGTNNSLTAAVPGNALTDDEMSSHGQAWFTSVISPVAAVAQHLPAAVTIWAGDDIEESSDGNWYDGPTTSAWVDAYAVASGASKPCVPTRSALLVDYGDYVPNVPGWSPEAVYHVAWQAPSACPVPEIYRATNASEWQSLNVYALNASLPQLQFTGVLSQNGAAGSLSNADSWNSLTSESGQAAPYLTVIGETGPIPPEVPDAPSSLVAVPGPGMVTLGWSAPAWDGGAMVTTYTVSVFADSILVQKMSFDGFPAPERVTIGGLAPGLSYGFDVSATNRVGMGPQSLPSTSVVPSGLIPLELN